MHFLVIAYVRGRGGGLESLEASLSRMHYEYEVGTLLVCTRTIIIRVKNSIKKIYGTSGDC